MRVPIRLGRQKPLFVVLGLGPPRSYLELGPEVVRRGRSACRSASSDSP